jgi:hypothetical protein
LSGRIRPAIQDSFFHPTQGNRDVEVIVEKSPPGASGSFRIEMTDSYS